MTRRSALLVAALLPTLVPLARAQDTLVAIGSLVPRTLRSQYFALDSEQQVFITAVGGEPQGRTALRRFLDHGVFQGKEETQWDADVWPANAWILDTRTREVVWELRTAKTQLDGNGLREFDGAVRLPAGAYEVNYAALFPVSRFWTDETDWRVRPASNEQPTPDRLHGPYLDDGSYRKFQIIVRGSGRRVTDGPVTLAPGAALVSLRGAKPDSRERIGFELDRPMSLQLYLLGEGEDSWNDYGWIMDATNRRVVWSAKNESGSPAGGAHKNRMVRRSLSLPAGRYVAVYATDGSHQASGWNEAPPYDPSSWGLTIRVAMPADRGAARTFTYQPIPTADAFVSLTRLGDNQLRWQRFAVSRPIDVRVFALGEGTGQPMHDYGWIVDRTGRAVWRMEFSQTTDAGGSTKNRVFTGTVHLAAGPYVAYFSTDGSHSFGGGWNAAEPMDAEYWGLTVAPAAGKRDAAAVAKVPDDAASEDQTVLAQLTKMGGGRTEEARFTLPSRSAVRVYAVGEGSGGMSDYASIENHAGAQVWRMTYDETEPAGGASKNRRVDRTMTLEAGSYTVRFTADNSHGWGDWNAALPDDPLAWGVTVYRVPAGR